MLSLPFEILKNKTFKKIEISENDDENNVITFTTEDNLNFKMYHEQDCCECVTIEDIAGDLDDLIGSPIVTAEERTLEGETNYGTYTCTFYELATIRGNVTIRWHGESNGYYSESVGLYKSKE